MEENTQMMSHGSNSNVVKVFRPRTLSGAMRTPPSTCQASPRRAPSQRRNQWRVRTARSQFAKSHQAAQVGGFVGKIAVTRGHHSQVRLRENDLQDAKLHRHDLFPLPAAALQAAAEVQNARVGEVSPSRTQSAARQHWPRLWPDDLIGAHHHGHKDK